MDIYINGGTGFHSNDARDVIHAARINQIIQVNEKRGLSSEEINQILRSQQFDPDHANIKTLPRAIGSELGTRLILGKGILVSIACWYLHMEEELVFVGDEGTTEISGETQRLGVDFEMRLQLASWIWADLDFNFADGRYLNEPNDANYIPLAPRFTSIGGVNFLHPKGIDGSVRFRYIGDRPANEDNSVVAEGHFLSRIILGYRFNRFRIFGQVENIFNVKWNEAQFDTESRLYYETSPVSELHFTPGNPFNIQAGISYEF
jgi:hypothetical protein